MEALLKRRENQQSDPDKAALLYKMGDIVVVKPDGWEWGNLEDPSKFVDPLDCGFMIVKVAGVAATQEQIDKWLAHNTDTGDEEGAMTRRREWYFDISELNTSRRNTLLNTGILEAQWGHVRSAIKNKDTGVSE